jgi:hypothetical protein
MHRAIFAGLAPGADRQDVVDNPLVLDLLRLFPAVKNFYISREHAQSILPVLRELDGGELTDGFSAYRICFRRDFSHRDSDVLRRALDS